MDKNEIQEEVTVTPVIRDIERLFNKLFKLIFGILGMIYQGAVNLINVIFARFIWFFILVLLGGSLGFFSTTFMPRQYASEMVLQLNVDSKEQLMNDVNYINALVNNQDTDQLEDIFKISPDDAKSLQACEVYPYSSYIEKTEALNQFYRNTDTAVFNELNFDQVMNPSNIELSSKFRIVFKGTDPLIFGQLEKPFLAYLERSPELQILLETGRQNLQRRKTVYQEKMQQLDTLAHVYNTAILTQAENAGQSQGSQTRIVLGEQESTNEFNALDIQDRYLFYTQSLAKIEQTLAGYHSCYLVRAHLSPVGSKTGAGPLTRAIYGAFFLFLLTALFFYWKSDTQKSA